MTGIVLSYPGGMALWMGFTWFFCHIFLDESWISACASAGVGAASTPPEAEFIRLLLVFGGRETGLDISTVKNRPFAEFLDFDPRR